MQETEKRKMEHVEVALKEDVHTTASNGFEKIRFLHYALPELDYSKISLETTFLGKKLSAPFMVTGMTGGCTEAEKINSEMAGACAEEGIIFAVGSQRAMLEDKSLKKTYAVKKGAFLCGNIGAYQLKKYSPKQIQSAIDDIRADALCVHLNPLQEAIQKEGDTDWTGVLEKITILCRELSVPVVAKEVGSGINGEVARELEKAGCNALDVSGLGGTSWSAVEHYRSGRSGDVFRDWGLPTAEALKQCSNAVRIPLIAAGGMRNGLEAAKAIRLGASIAGAAAPFLEAQQEGGPAEVKKLIKKWKHELKTAMFLTRSKNLGELRKAKLLE